MSAALFDTVVAHRTFLSFGGEPLFDGEQLNLICTSIFPQTPFQQGSKASSMSSSSAQAKPSRYEQAPSTADSVGLCDDDIDSHLSYRSKASTSSRLSSTPNPAPGQRNSTTRLSSQKHPNLSDANLRNSVSDPEQKFQLLVLHSIRVRIRGFLQGLHRCLFRRSNHPMRIGQQ